MIGEKSEAIAAACCALSSSGVDAACATLYPYDAMCNASGSLRVAFSALPRASSWQVQSYVAGLRNLCPTLT